MLFQVLQYIQREQVASIDQLARVFRTDRLALEPLLKRLMMKNLVLAHQPQCATSCMQCTPSLIYYTASPGAPAPSIFTNVV